ncbi:MAG: NAD(P)H-dependent oxidoreductase [Erysipelotrichaceae bacterium]|nr:NAD(P)H-dependent oxidoreductase [Erysipelotrichaceae bacterium]
MKKIVFIIGSLRRESFNLQLFNEIKRIIGNRADVSVLNYSDIPYMNEDIEFPPPESVSRVRKEIQNADGIWIVSPEYNQQIPGVLKNLLDWLSRPLLKRDYKTGSVVKGKPVTISGAAGKSGALKVRIALKDLLEMMSLKVVFGTGVGISMNTNTFATGKLEVDDEIRGLLIEQVEQFLLTLHELNT